MRLTIFFFRGRPSALLRYQTNLTWLSFASEPELQKNTLEIGTGAISLSFSASSMAGSWLRPVNRWAKDNFRICAAAASTSSSLP